MKSKWVCPKCGMKRRPDGHDPCLGELPGVVAACCGHGGHTQAYIYFNNGTVVRMDQVTVEHSKPTNERFGPSRWPKRPQIFSGST